MSDHVLVDRLQFTLTVTFHYLFPILMMGLALFIFLFEDRQLHRLAPRSAACRPTMLAAVYFTFAYRMFFRTATVRSTSAAIDQSA